MLGAGALSAGHDIVVILAVWCGGVRGSLSDIQSMVVREGSIVVSN